MRLFCRNDSTSFVRSDTFEIVRLTLLALAFGKRGTVEIRRTRHPNGRPILYNPSFIPQNSKTTSFMPFPPLISRVGLLACAALLSAGAEAAEPSAPPPQKTAAQPQKTEAPLSFDEARTRLHGTADRLRIGDAQIAHDQNKEEAARAMDGPQIDLSAMQVWGSKTVEMSFDNPLAGTSLPIPLPGSFDIGMKEDIGGPRASLNMVWPLYTGGMITAKQEALRHKVTQSRAERDATEQTLDTELAAKYWGVQLARSVEALRSQMLEDEEESLARAKRFEERGVIAPIERMTVEVSRDTAKRELIVAQTNRRVAETELGHLLKTDAIPELRTPLFVIDGDLGTLTDWTEKALRLNPQLTGVRAQRNQALEGVKAAEGAFHPKLFAYGQKNLIKHYLTLPEPDWIAGIGVTFTLWSQSDRRASLRAAEALVTKADAAHSEVENALKNAVEVAYLRVTEARHEYRLTESTVALARENLRLREKSFAEGLSTALDLNTARSQLTGAEIARRGAAYKFVVSWAMLHAASGDMPGFLASLSRSDLVVTP